jgi:hypothetical protein
MNMSHTLLIAARDVRDKGSLYLISAVLAVMPFLALLLPSSTGRHRDVLIGFSGILALAMGLGLALGLGISTFGRPLSEKRMSFWFSKPLSPSALWIGKSMGALFTSFACFAIILIPSVIAAGIRAISPRYGKLWEIPLVVMVGMLVLYVIGHVLGTMTRSRSVILGLDLLGLVLTLTIGLLLLRPLLFHSIFKYALTGTLLAALVVLVIAPYWQLANGRTDVRRSHGALSKALWTGTAIVLTLGALGTFWLSTAKPQNFDQVMSLEQSPTGNSVVLTGSAPFRRGIEPTFLHDVRTGKSERLHVPPYWGATYSRNGRFAAWVEPSLFNWSRGSVVVRDLEAGRSEVLDVEAGLFLSIAFSDDASRLAIRDGLSLTVYERATGKILAAIPMKAGRPAFFFAGNDVLRIYRNESQTMTAIEELSLVTKTLTRTGVLNVASSQLIALSADGSRMLIKKQGILADGRTGATIATLATGTDDSFWASTMLSDGRTVIGRRSTGTGTISASRSTLMTIYAPDGEKQHEVAVPDHLMIVGEREGGKVVLMGLSNADLPSDNAEGRSMYLVDVNRGVLEKTVRDTKGPAPQWSADPRLVRYSANTRFAAVDKQGKLTYWQ